MFKRSQKFLFDLTSQIGGTSTTVSFPLFEIGAVRSIMAGGFNSGLRNVNYRSFSWHIIIIIVVGLSILSGTFVRNVILDIMRNAGHLELGLHARQRSSDRTVLSGGGVIKRRQYRRFGQVPTVISDGRLQVNCFLWYRRSISGWNCGKRGWWKISVEENVSARTLL